MTDRRSAGPISPGLRRWPTSPAHFTDTTLCPSCFERLASSHCGMCGLDLSTPDATRLLAAGERVREAETDRQRLLAEVGAAQAATLVAPVSASTAVVARPAPAAPPSQPIVMPVAPPVPGTVPAEHVVARPAPPAVSPSRVAATADRQPSSPLAPVVGDAPRRRSGVQVFLLALGVVLISITAIVFLFVAYLVAGLEVRSVIIAAASVLVLGVAWLLRARRLPGTAEGVAAVAVVLLLLDVWIVRANGLFGTDALGSAGYTGGALLVVAGLLALTRVVTGIRVPGFAAAALIPVAAFLLGVQAAPETEVATGAWVGGLAMTLVGAVGVLVPTRVERTILLSGGFAGGALAFVVAVWALPEAAWPELWTFGLVAVAWLVVLAALRMRAAAVSGVWTDVAAAGLGLAAAIAPAAAIASELPAGPASWLAPAASGAVVCLFALVHRLSGARAWLVALVAAAAVAAAAALPGLAVGAAAVGAKVFGSTLPTGPFRAGSAFRLDDEAELGAVLVPLVIAVVSTAVLALLGRLRGLAAVPIGAVLAALIVVGAVVDPAWASAAVWLAIAVGALVWAALAGRRVPGLTTVLAVAGASAAGLGWWLGFGDPGVWPWASAVVIAAAFAGRVLAALIWSRGARPIGLVHVVLASALLVTTLGSFAWWLDAVGVPLAQPVTTGWIIAGLGTSLLLGLAMLVAVATPGDRLAFAIPMLATAIISVAALAFTTTDASWRWTPAAVLTLAAAVGLRRSAPSGLRIAFAAVAPLSLGVAVALITLELAGSRAIGYALAATTLATAAIAHLVARHRAGAATIAWVAAVALLGTATLAMTTAPAGEPWLVLAVLAPVPIVLAAIAGDPIAGDAPWRHVGWLTPVLAIGSVWAWLLGDGVETAEAYTLPLAVVVAGCGTLIAWRRSAKAAADAGRTALFGTAAAIAVLPSVASAGDSALRTLVLVGGGAVVAIAGGFLPTSLGGVPARLLVVATGWTALSGAAIVRGLALARGVEGADPIELWPAVALAAGVVVALVWARSESRPAWLAEVSLAASLVLAVLPTLLAIVSDEHPLARTAVLFWAVAVAHVVGVAVRARPVAGPVFAWTTRGILVIGGVIVLARGSVEPFDLVTVPVGLAFTVAGVLAMRRSPALGSWPALGAGLAVLLVPPLVADFTDPQLWRVVALGVASLTVLVVGVVRRLQAPVLIGGGVLLVHAVVQLWPYIATLYEAVWWWLWLGIAGVLLVVLAATYERQLRFARSTIGSIAALR
ncbi:SCO7613 C-terminal domain-containing membrane protein [Agromyces sp. NPDC055658]